MTPERKGIHDMLIATSPKPKEDPAEVAGTPSNEAMELRETLPQAISSPPRWGSRDFRWWESFL